MDILSLNKEELSAVVENRDLFEEYIVKSKGIVAQICDAKQVNMDLNTLFAGNQINITVLEYIYPILTKKFNTLNDDTILTISSLITTGNHNEDYGDLSELFDKIIGYCEEKQLKVRSLNEVKIYNGYGKNKNYGKEKVYKFVNPLLIDSTSLDQLEQSTAVEKPYSFEKESYEYESDEEENEIIVQIEEKVELLKDKDISKLIVPYNFNDKLFENIHDSLYSRDLNKDDLELQKYEPQLSQANKILLEQLKEDIKNPTDLTLNFLVQLNNLNDDKLKTIYLMLSNDEALSLLKNDKLIELAGNTIAELAIYNELKKKEALFFEEMTYIFNAGIEDESVYWNFFIKTIISENKLGNLFSAEDLKKVEHLIPKNKSEEHKLLELTEEIVKVAMDKLLKINNSNEMNIWRKDFKEYCSLNIRRFIMGAIEVPLLKENDLSFIREQVKLTENRTTEILENNLSKVTVGLSYAIMNTSAYVETKTIFNNDKTLLLKDLFLESIKKPFFVVDSTDYSSTYQMLIKYDNPEELISNHKKIVHSAFKYLTPKEALELNYHQRTFILESNQTIYVLQREHEKLSKLSKNDWKDLFKLQSNLVSNEINSVSEKIKKMKNVFKPEELIDADIAEIMIKEFLNKKEESSFQHYDNAIKMLNTKEIKEIENPIFYYNNDLIKTVVNSKPGEKLEPIKKSDKEIVLEMFNEILNGKNIEDFALENGLKDYYFSIRDRNSNLLLLAINKFIEKSEENNELSKVKFVLMMAVQLYESISSYEAEREKTIDDYIPQLLQLDIYLDKYGFVPLEKGMASKFIFDNYSYLNKFKSKNEPQNREEENYLYLKEKLNSSALAQLGLNNNDKKHQVSKTLEAIIFQTKILDVEEHEMPSVIDVEKVKVAVSEILSELSPEFTFELLNSNSLKNIGLINWDKNALIKEIFSKYYGDELKDLTLYGQNFNEILDNPNLIDVFGEALRTLSISKRDNILNMAKKFDSEVNTKLSEKESILLKIENLEKKVELNEEHFKSMLNRELLARVDATDEEKLDILRKNSITHEKYKILEEQKKTKFHIEYPYEEVFSLFKESIDIAEKAFNEICFVLESKGWKKQDLYNLDFSSLRLQTYRRNSAFSDEQSKEIAEVSNIIFKKYYTKERLMANALLNYPLNNQAFKFLMDNLEEENDKDKFKNHEKMRNKVNKYLEDKYNNASISTLQVLSELELNNRNVLFNLFKLNGLFNDDKNIDENIKYIFSKVKYDEIFLHNYHFDKLNLDELINYAFETNNANIITSLLEVSIKDDLKYLAYDRKVDEFGMREKFQRSLDDLISKMKNETINEFLNKINKEIDQENIRRENVQENIKNNKKYKVIPNITSLSSIINLIYDESFTNSQSKENMKKILRDMSIQYRIERADRIIKHPLITGVIKSIFEIDGKNINNLDRESLESKINEMLNKYSREVAISNDIKFDLINKYEEQILSLNNKESVEKIEKIFKVNNHEDFIISKEALTNLINLYNEYKEQGGGKYLLAHIALYRQIAFNLSIDFLKDTEKKLERDSTEALGNLLFFENIDIKEILSVINKSVEKVDEYKQDDVAKKLIFLAIGSIYEKNYDFNGYDSELSDLYFKITQIFDEEKAMMVDQIIAEKNKDKMKKIFNADISLLGLKSISGIDIKEIEGYSTLFNEYSNKPLLSLINDIGKDIPIGISEMSLGGLEEIIAKKMQANQTDELASLAKIIDLSSERSSNYRIGTFLQGINNVTELKVNKKTKSNEYNKFMQICNKLSQSAIYEDIKSFERMKELYGRIEPEKKERLKKKAKI